jgi:hypothetical protein
VIHQAANEGSAPVRHVADAAVDRLGAELDAARLQLGPRRLDVVDVVDAQGDRMVAGTEVIFAAGIVAATIAAAAELLRRARLS